jgi:uncharacterized protein YkwD
MERTHAGSSTTRPRASIALTATLLAMLTGCEGRVTSDPIVARPGSDAGPARSAIDAAIDAAPPRDGAPSFRVDGAPPPTAIDDGGAPAVDAGTIDTPIDAAPAAPVDAGPPPPEPCGALTEIGGCEGSTAAYCDFGVVRRDDCAARGQVCGMVGGGFFRCFVSADPCGGVSAAGSCSGSVATYCESTSVTIHDCAAFGQPCGDIGGGVMRCISPDSCAALGAVGACRDLVASFCDGATPHSDDCGARSEMCGDVGGVNRCMGPAAGCGSAVEQEELRITNAERTAAGLAPLVCDEALTRASRGHSQDMCDRMYFEHVSPEGATVADRIRAQGGAFTIAAENIALGSRTPAIVHASWMESAGHRANILRPEVRRIGIGFVYCSGRPLWTQSFTD